MTDELRPSEPLGFVDSAVALAQEVEGKARELHMIQSRDPDTRELAHLISELAASVGLLGNMFKERAKD